MVSCTATKGQCRNHHNSILFFFFLQPCLYPLTSYTFFPIRIYISENFTENIFVKEENRRKFVNFMRNLGELVGMLLLHHDNELKVVGS